METTTKNILHGVTVGAIHAFYSIILPWLLIAFLPQLPSMFGGGGGGDGGEGGDGGGDMSFEMGFLGNIELITYWIICFGIITVSLKVAKAYSPKSIGSIRREALGLGQKVIRWFVILACIILGTTGMYLNMGEMGLIVFDLAPYFLMALGFVLIRMIINIYGVVEAIIITKRGR